GGTSLLPTTEDNLTGFRVARAASCPDADGDGIGSCQDNCPTVANPTQANADGDGSGDACDACPNDAGNDADGDGICVGAGFNPPKTGANDNCPTTANANQANADADASGDACDVCPGDAAN